MSTSHAYTVTIGRNVGTQEMSLDLWEAFELRIKRLLTHVAEQQLPAAYFIEKHTGVGLWDDVWEDSLKIALIIETEVNVTYLSELLSEVARDFSQEAIALNVGTVTLIEP